MSVLSFLKQEQKEIEDVYKTEDPLKLAIASMDPCAQKLLAVALNPNCPVWILENLSRDPYEKVRGAAIEMLRRKKFSKEDIPLV